jgi:DNA-directed RNA polymerase specialized sigma24 family protein
MAIAKSVWTLTPEAFERLLSALDADREHAGVKYEKTRRKLLEFFEARGSHTPEEHADETLNRVARRMLEGEVVEYLDRYSYGVARLLWLETLRSRDRQSITLDENRAIAELSPSEHEQTQLQQEKERKIECFEECLHRFPDETRLFILEYYREEKGLKIEQRKQQAARLNTTLNALRLRASRLRRELGVCIRSCVARTEVTVNQRFVTNS